MPETSWWQHAVESAIYEAPGIDDKISLARLAILERLVAPASADPNDEDELFDALNTLRALDWERVSSATEQMPSPVG